MLKGCFMAENNEGYIDDLDFAILAHLQEDGRKSFTDIAKALGIAVGTVRNRVTKMLEEKTVRIIGRVDPQRVGFNVFATICLHVEPQYLEAAVEKIGKFPEVSWLTMLTGEYDVNVDVMCRNGDHLSEFLYNRLYKVKGVIDVHTSIVLRTCRFAQPDVNLVKAHNITPNNSTTGLRG